MIPEYQYRADQELPAMALEWLDGSGALQQFATGWAFTVKVAKASAPLAVLLTKTVGVVGANTSPNITISWTTSDFTALAASPSGTDYVVYTYARRTADTKDDVFNPGNLPRFRLWPAPV